MMRASKGLGLSRADQIDVGGEQRRYVSVHEENIAVAESGVRLLTSRAPREMTIVPN